MGKQRNVLKSLLKVQLSISKVSAKKDNNIQRNKDD